MPPRGRGQRGMRGRGRGRGGSTSANASGDEGGNQSGRGRSTNTTRPRANRGGSQAPRGAARGLMQALQQAGTPPRSRGQNQRSQNQRGRGNLSGQNSPRSNSRPNTPRPNGLSPAPSRTPPSSSRNNAADMSQRLTQARTPPGRAPPKRPANRREQVKQDREKEREDAIAKGYIVDPDRPRALAEAVTPIGTCPDMCPVYERLMRISRRDYFLQELDPSTVELDRSQHRVDESRMVKAFKRSAAGTDEQLPSDLRPPDVLKRTCQYLFKTLLSEKGQSLETAYGFIWDRSRAIRNDFSIQQLNKVSDIQVAIECLEWIARFHILTLHQIGGLPKNKRPERYDYFQDLEQLDKTLLSLLAHYHNVRHHYHPPNEAEFRAYRIIYQITSPKPNVEDTVQLWPADVIRDPRVQRALKLYNAAQTIRQEQGPLAPRVGHPVAQENWNRFFKLVKSKQTSFLMSCVAEIYFNFLRHKAMRAIWRAYRTGGEGRVSDGWSLVELGKALGYDSEAQVRTFVDIYGFKVVKKDDGKLYLDVNSVGRNFPAPLEDKQEPQLSKKLVERKRYHRTASAIINGLSVNTALEAGLVTRAVKGKEKNAHGNGVKPLFVKGAAAGRANSLPGSAQSPSNAVDFSGISSSLKQNKEAAPVRAEATQPTLTFSPQPPPRSDLKKETSTRREESLFVTGDSDEEEGTAKMEKAFAAIASNALPTSQAAPAPTPSPFNPFAQAFSSAASSVLPTSQPAPASNLFSAPPTSNFFASAQTSAPTPALSASTSPSSIFAPRPAQSSTLFPTPDSSNIFTGAQTTVSTTKPFSFDFTAGVTSTPTSSNPFIFSSATTTTAGNMGNTPSAPSRNQSTFPSATPPTADNMQSSSSRNLFAPPTPAPATNHVAPALAVGESASDNKSAEKKKSTIRFPIHEKLRQEIFERYKSDPDMATRLIARLDNHILPTKLALVYAEALEKFDRVVKEHDQMENIEIKRQLAKDILDAKGSRGWWEGQVRKSYLAAVEEEEKTVKKEREAWREQSYEHFKGIRTQEVMQYLIRQVATKPRDFPQYRESDSVFGIVPKFAEATAAAIFREALIENKKEKEQRELERKQAEDDRRRDRGRRFRERGRILHKERAEKEEALERAEEEKRKAEEAEKAADMEMLYNTGKNWLADVDTSLMAPGQKLQEEAYATYAPPSRTPELPPPGEEEFQFNFGARSTRNSPSRRPPSASQRNGLRDAHPASLFRASAPATPRNRTMTTSTTSSMPFPRLPPATTPREHTTTSPRNLMEFPKLDRPITPQAGDKRKRQDDEADIPRSNWHYSNYFQRKAAGLLDWQLKRPRTKEDYYYPYITLPAGTVHKYSDPELRRMEEESRERREALAARERERRSASASRPTTSGSAGRPTTSDSAGGSRPGSVGSNHEELMAALDEAEAGLEETGEFFKDLRKRIEAGDKKLFKALQPWGKQPSPP